MDIQQVATSVSKGRTPNVVFKKGLKMLDGTYVKPGSIIKRVVLAQRDMAIVTIDCLPRKPKRQPNVTRVYSLSRMVYDRLVAPNNIYTMLLSNTEEVDT